MAILVILLCAAPEMYAGQHVASIAEAVTLISATLPETTLPITVVRDGA
jgi:hypothetical protein